MEQASLRVKASSPPKGRCASRRLAILAQLLQLQVEGGVFVTWVVGVAFAAQDYSHRPRLWFKIAAVPDGALPKGAAGLMFTSAQDS